jgi:hypothetical protein
MTVSVKMLNHEGVQCDTNVTGNLPGHRLIDIKLRKAAWVAALSLLEIWIDATPCTLVGTVVNIQMGSIYTVTPT